MDHPREEKRSGHLVTLPDDLLFMEVLFRLPVKSLACCKCVCLNLCTRIEDADFVRHHRDRSNMSQPSMLIIPRKHGIEDQEELSEDISFYHLRPGETTDTFEEKAEMILEKVCPPEAEGITNTIFVTHCDGLVAIATGTDEVFLCNPATKELVILPLGTPDVEIDTMRPRSAVIGFDRWKNQYVIARCFYRRRCYNESSGKLDYDIGHEIFTLGDNSWSWKPTVDPPHAIGCIPLVFTHDAFYWGCDANEDPLPSSLMRFSLRHRTFELVPCPPHFSYNFAVEHLADLGGKLCYVNLATSETTFDVWQLEYDGTIPPHWFRRCRIEPDHDISFGSDAFLPLLAVEGRMLVMVSDGDQKLSWCNEKSGDVEEVVHLREDVDLKVDSNYYIHHIIPYHESLVSIRKCKV